jgi:glycosyltransferase involved in cell wall biosynthesis
VEAAEQPVVPTETVRGEEPLVSCVMPTADRRALVLRAIGYFLRQDYPNRELVILDDGMDSIADLVPADEPSVRYVRLTGRRTLGAKRNACVEAARGDLLMHWDDDDWMASHRISYQVEALLGEGAEVCGLRRMLFYEPSSGESWLYEYPARQRPWLAGGSLLYTREFWRRSPFPDVQVGEDTRFVWDRRLERALALPDYRFYVALIHPGNTSPKTSRGSYWSRWSGDIRDVMGKDLAFYQELAQGAPPGTVDAAPAARATRPDAAPDAAAVQPVQGADEPSPTYTVVMVAHNALEMTRLATLRTLRHSAGQDARLVVVDNGSSDGTERWLDVLARRGDIDLIRSEVNLGHGPAIELARRRVRSPYLVTLDSDAFPLADDWLSRLRARLTDTVKVAGIRHHRDYVHPSCLMIEAATLDELGLTFLDEKDRPSQLDVAERISLEVKRRGLAIAGLERTEARRRGSRSEPVYLGSSYEGLVYHQWYTTRAATSPGRDVDDVPREAIERCLDEVLAGPLAEPRDVTVVVGVRDVPGEPSRRRNAEACLRALNFQDLPRWRYRIVLVEQDDGPRLQGAISALADRYVFARNPGPYNRGWGFNVGARAVPDRAGALCLIDADLLVPPDFLRRGLEALRAGRRAALPYQEVVYLDAGSTERAIRERLADPMRAAEPRSYDGQAFRTSQGGCVWVEAGLYHAIGGHDERFRGWGWEDREFWSRLSRATGVERLPGSLLHLDHPRPAMGDRAALENQRLHAEVAAGRAGRPVGPIGDPGRYAGEAARPEPAGPAGAVGRRDWERWHRWEAARIERIVRDEGQRTASSARGQLADLAASLGDRLLDVGSGPGAIWPHLERHRPRLTWEGVDATEEMRAVARRLFPWVPLHHGDAGDLPFADASFEVVLLRHVLEHLPPWLMARAVGEATRVASRAVVLAFFVAPSASGARQTSRVGEGFLETRWTVADVEGPIERSGWRVAERRVIAGDPGECDEVWVLRPPEDPPGRAPEAAAAGYPDGPKVSIVMPTYRRPHTIERTVDSIRRQSYRNWELIVVDNAGDGGYCFDDDRIRVFRHDARASASYARNQGLRHATGELVCFFDDDDDMFPHYLERLVTAFREHPNAQMARCGMIVSGGRTNFSFATPECCLRREFATPTWTSSGNRHDQQYFESIVRANGWSEASGEVVLVPEALCRANTDPRGGLRSGRL